MVPGWLGVSSSLCPAFPCPETGSFDERDELDGRVIQVEPMPIGISGAQREPSPSFRLRRLRVTWLRFARLVLGEQLVRKGARLAFGAFPGLCLGKVKR